MTDIALTDTPHGLHLDTDGGTPVTLSPDAVTAIVQHELAKVLRPDRRWPTPRTAGPTAPPATPRRRSHDHR